MVEKHIWLITGGRKKNIPFRRQRMEIDTTVPAQEPIPPPSLVTDDPYVADLLKVADDKIAELTESYENFKKDAEGQAEKVTILKKQVRIVYSI